VETMMIRNEQEYQHSLEWLRRFQESVAELDNNETLKAEPIRWQLHRDSYQSQVDELKSEIAEYERLVNCDRTHPIQIQVENLNKLPDALIKARIAAKMTQKELAEILDIDEQKVEKYEKTDYQYASFGELLEVSAALGVEFTTAIMNVDFAEIEEGKKIAEKWRKEKLKKKTKTS
jgi:DNA-binding XRE family transcriptional regulator